MTTSSFPLSLGHVVEAQVLHTTTTRTLHAHNFSRTSSRATYVLTDILSRYLVLLSETCARYAQHAGRTGVTVRDAISALGEIGVDMEELKEYAEGEAKELARYTAQTAKRAEELTEIQVAVRDGTFHDPFGDIPLVYAPLEEDYDTTSDDGNDHNNEDEETEDLPIKTESYAEENFGRNDVNLSDPAAAIVMNSDTDPSSIRPPKRTRLSDSDSNSHFADYVPSFFPRFPNEIGFFSSTSTVSVTGESTPPLKPPPSPSPPSALPRIDLPEAPGPTTENSQLQNGVRVHLPVRQPSPALPTLTSASSSYLVNIPHEHSSLANVPEWRLPKPASSVSLTNSVLTSTIPSLLSSYSYLQSSSLSASGALTSNPLHHSLAMMMVGLSSRAYSPAPTMFGTSSVNTCVPRRVAFLPAYAVPLDKNGKPILNSAAPTPATLPLPPPEWHARSVASPIAYVEPTTMQGSRIPVLARNILSHSVLMKISRLNPPPPLERNGQKLFYGPPVSAHWNSGTNTASGGEQKALKGKEKGEEEEELASRVLADAHLLATWDYDLKDFRQGLPMVRRGSKAVPHHGLQYGGSSGNGSSAAAIGLSKRKRSESLFGS